MKRPLLLNNNAEERRKHSSTTYYRILWILLIFLLLSSLTIGITSLVFSTRAGGQTLAGDDVGPQQDNVVVRLQQRPLADTEPVAGQMIGWDGNQWEPATIDSVSGSNIAISNTGSTVHVATTQAVAIEVLSVADSTLLGMNTSCIRPLLPSCYDISAQTCTTPLDSSCIGMDLVLNSLMVYNLTLINATQLDLQVSNQTALYVDQLFVNNEYLSSTLTCPGGTGYVDQGCLRLANYSCPLGEPLAESCIPASLVQYDQTVTHTLTVNMVTCAGPPLPESCLPSLTLTGDVTGTLGANTVEKLQGYAVNETAPFDGAALVWDTITSSWTPTGETVYYGTNTQANSTQYSVTLGAEASTIGNTYGQSVAVGYNAIASAAISTALASYSLASGSGAVAVGNGAQATGAAAVAVGQNARAFGTNNIAMGLMPIVSGSDNIGIGRFAGTAVSTNGAIAMGKNAQATADSALCIGNTCISNTRSVVLGQSAQSNSIVDSIAIGYLAVVPDTAHGLALTLPTQSVTPQALGVRLNANLRVIPIYASLYASTAGAGPTVLTISSAHNQVYTTAQTVRLPVTTTLELGFTFRFINRSVGNLVIQSSGSNTIITLATFTSADLVCILASGTTAASWSALGPVTAT